MALTNMLREPKRELTESFMGLTTFGLFAIPYTYGAWKLIDIGFIAYPHDKGDWFIAVFLGYLIEAMLTGAFIGLLFVTHEIGDSICNVLKRHGLDPRPRRYYE